MYTAFAVPGDNPYSTSEPIPPTQYVPFPCPDFSQGFPWWLLPPPPPGTPPPSAPTTLAASHTTSFLNGPWDRSRLSHYDAGYFVPRPHSSTVAQEVPLHYLSQPSQQNTDDVQTCTTPHEELVGWAAGGEAGADVSGDWEPTEDNDEAETFALSDEWAERFALTEIRREERRRQRNERLTKSSYGAASDQKGTTTSYNLTNDRDQPPAGETLEAKDPTLLYGKKGAKQIGELEATLNARFDSLLDQLQPKFWPCEPMDSMRAAR